MELEVLAATLDSREAYNAIAGRLDVKDFTEYGQRILSEVAAYYKADSVAQSVDRSLVASALSKAYSAPEQSRALVDYLGNIPESESTGNVTRVYKSLRRHNTGLSLADKLVQADHGPRTQALAETYLELSRETTEDDWIPLLSVDDMYPRGAKGKLRVYPSKLNSVLGGGLSPGDSVMIFGRPGSGKTALAVNFCAAALHKGNTVLYVGTEENQIRLQRRFLSRMGKVELRELNKTGRHGRRAAKKAERVAKTRGYDNLYVLHGNMSVAAIGSYVQRLGPQILVVDQFQHIGGEKENRTLTMETTMRQLRDLATAQNLVVIVVCQAGESAENKRVLGLTDVDYSNTGAQGACDVMIGMGYDIDMDRNHKRLLHFCRNKIAGEKAIVPVWLDKQYSAIRGQPIGG